jgi:hypothetical protein
MYGHTAKLVGSLIVNMSKTRPLEAQIVHILASNETHTAFDVDIGTSTGRRPTANLEA